MSTLYGSQKRGIPEAVMKLTECARINAGYNGESYDEIKSVYFNGWNHGAFTKI